MNRDQATSYLVDFLTPYAPADEWDLDSILVAAFISAEPGELTLAVTDSELLHIATRNIISGPLSEVDCPPWCDRTAGHRYDRDVDNALHRWHELKVPGQDRIGIDIVQLETAASAAGPIARTAPYAALWIDGNEAADQLSADQCRAAGRALIAAARRLDAVSEGGLGA